MKKQIIITAATTFVLISITYFFLFRVFFGETTYPFREKVFEGNNEEWVFENESYIKYKIFNLFNENWFYKYTNFVPNYIYESIKCEILEELNDTLLLVKYNDLIENGYARIYVKYYSLYFPIKEGPLRINLKHFNHFIAPSCKSRTQVVDKYSRLAAYLYENRLTLINNQGVIDSIRANHMKTLDSNCTSCIKKFADIMPEEKKDKDCYSIIFWSKFDGLRLFEFEFYSNSNKLKK
jgi:hypothetical protein